MVGAVNVRAVCPDTAAQLEFTCCFCHCTVGVGVPVPATVSTTLWFGKTVRPTGWVVIAGNAPVMVNVPGTNVNV